MAWSGFSERWIYKTSYRFNNMEGFSEYTFSDLFLYNIKYYFSLCDNILFFVIKLFVTNNTIYDAFTLMQIVLD